MLYADVVLELPVPKLLTYSVPDELSSSVTEGCAVMVPLRTAGSRGYIVSLYRSEPIKGIKNLSALIEEIPPLPRELLDAASKVSRQYLYTWGDVLKAAVPLPAGKTIKRFRITDRGAARIGRNKDGFPEKILRLLQKEGELNAAQLQRRLKVKGVASLLRELQKKGWVTAIVEQTSASKPMEQNGTSIHPSPELYKECARAHHDTAAAHRSGLSSVWEVIKGSLSSENSRPLLLQSASLGDRENIYLQAADYVIRRGKSVIILKPEIAPTRPFIEKLKHEFHEKLLVTHSGLTAKSRWEQWQRAARVECSVVAGARAAVLQAVRNLGLIIVDEEDDEVYKQEEIPRYHARDVALIRGEVAKCSVILGSSVPSMESLYLAAAGKMEHINLTSVEARSKSRVELVDLKQKSGRGTISPLLVNCIGDTLKKHGQTLLFLNRRGYATSIQCRDCGFVLRCTVCNISLTYHTQSGKAKCRYCPHEESGLSVCPNCGGNKIWYMGMGTQKVEREIRKLFPEATVCRLDSDTVKEKGGLELLLETIERGETQIVVSTQLAQPYLLEHDFALTGVIYADAILNMPDFRAAERAFRLVYQLAGSETGKSGARKVIVQSYNPDHYSLTSAQKLDCNGFYNEEMERREELAYPPLTKMISVRVEGGPGSGAEPLAVSLAEDFQSRAPEHSDVTVMGPTLVHLARARSKMRWQILLKGSDEAAVEELARWALNEFAHRGKGNRKVQVSVDVDPISLF